MIGWLYMLATMLLTVAIPLLAGYALTVSLSETCARKRMAYAMGVGLAAMVAAASLGGTFLPCRIFALGLPIAATATFVLVRPAAKNFVRDVRILGRDRTFLAAMGAAGLFVLWLNFPALSLRHAVIFEYGRGQDDFLYVSNALWLQDHTALQVPVFSLDHPVFTATISCTGMHPQWGRLGAESVLACLAAILHADPIFCYVPFFAALNIFWLAATFLLATSLGLSRTGWAPILAVTLSIAQPLFVFTFACENLPNTLGVILATYFLVLFRKAQLTGRISLSPALILTILLNALIATYIEVATVLAVVLAFLCTADALSMGRKRGWKRLLWTAGGLTCVATVAAAINPWASLRAYSGLINSVKLSHEAKLFFGNLFAHLPRHDFVPAIFTLNPAAVLRIPSPLTWLIAGVIVVLVGQAIWRAADRPLFGAIIAAFALLFGYVIHQEFGYGYQKTVQYFGPAFAAISACSLFSAFAAHRTENCDAAPRSIRTLHAVTSILGLVFASFLLFTTAHAAVQIHRYASLKHIDRDYLALPRQLDQAVDHAAVLIRDDTSALPDFDGLWLVYLVRDRPIYFPKYSRGAGYLNLIDSVQSAPHPPELSLASTDAPLSDLFEAIPINPRFLLFRPSATLVTAGLSYPERVGRWMGNESSFIVSSNSPVFLNLRIVYRFDPLPADSPVRVTAPAGWGLIHPSHDRAAFSVPIPAGRNLVVTLRSVNGAHSPREFNGSPDDRPLSFVIAEPSLSRQPQFAVPHLFAPRAE